MFEFSFCSQDGVTVYDFLSQKSIANLHLVMSRSECKKYLRLVPKFIGQDRYRHFAEDREEARRLFDGAARLAKFALPQVCYSESKSQTSSSPRKSRAKRDHRKRRMRAASRDEAKKSTQWYNFQNLRLDLDTTISLSITFRALPSCIQGQEPQADAKSCPRAAQTSPPTEPGLRTICRAR